MPVFDLIILIRKLERAQLKEVLKRSAQYVFEVGGNLRKMENLGFRNLPYTVTVDHKKFTAAHCFAFKFDGTHEKSKELYDKFKLDVDVLRARSWLNARTIMDFHVKEEEPECTIYLDLLPAPYRPSVITLQNLAKKKKKHTHKNYGDSDFLIY